MPSAFAELSRAIWEVREQSLALPVTPISRKALMFKTISVTSGHSGKSQFLTKVSVWLAQTY